MIPELNSFKENYGDFYELVQQVDYSIEIMTKPETAIHSTDHHEPKNWEFIYSVIHSPNMTKKLCELSDLWNKVCLHEEQRRRDSIAEKKRATREKNGTSLKPKKDKKKIF